MLEKTVFSLLNGLGTLLENQLTIYTEVYFWALHSILLFYMSTFMLVDANIVVDIRLF